MIDCDSEAQGRLGDLDDQRPGVHPCGGQGLGDMVDELGMGQLQTRGVDRDARAAPRSLRRATGWSAGTPPPARCDPAR